MRIISYFGNLYLPEFRLHIAEMKEKGFNVILLCITQTDILFNLVIFEEFVDYARSQEMAVYTTYWGFMGIGEAVNTEESPHNFLKAMKDINVLDILIDEPKQINNLAWFTDHNEFNFHMCLCDEIFNKLSDEQIKSMPVKTLGVSVYHLGHRDWAKVIKRTDDITKRLHRLRPDDNFVFIQAFDIPNDMHDMPQIVKQKAERNGIVNFGCWSFRATIATGTKRPVNPDKVWNAIKW